MDKIRKKIGDLATGDGMEVDSSEDPAGEMTTLINDCKFSMKLQMANSAWKQVKKLHKILYRFFFFLATNSSRANGVFRITLRWPPSF